jgi:hypothetical protein
VTRTDSEGLVPTITLPVLRAVSLAVPVMTVAPRSRGMSAAVQRVVPDAVPLVPRLVAHQTALIPTLSAAKPASVRRAVDATNDAEDVGDAVMTVTYLDRETPVVTLVSPTSAATFTTSATSLILAGTATDNVGVTSVDWTTDTGLSGSATGTASWSTGAIALAPGETQIVVSAHDGAGNRGSATLRVTMMPQVAPPAIDIVTPQDRFVSMANELSVTGVASSDAGIIDVSWSNDRGGGGLATGQTSWHIPSVSLQPGTNVVSVTARDALGGSATAAVTVLYESDTIAPAVSITNLKGQKHNTTGTSVLLAGVAVDNVAVTEVTWTSDRGGSGVAEGTSVWSAVVPLEEGDNTIVVTARDAAGNTAQARIVVERKTQGGGGTGRR